MTEFEQYIKDRNAKAGRTVGTKYLNSKKSVYAAMKKAGQINIEYTIFNKILNKVGEKVWEYVYAGHHIAVPFLFNMEVVPNKIEWPKAIDWKRTHEWWCVDSDAFRDRLLVRRNPTRNILRIRHSTISRSRNQWYWPLMLEIRPSKGRVREIETKYTLQ